MMDQLQGLTRPRGGNDCLLQLQKMLQTHLCTRNKTYAGKHPNTECHPRLPVATSCIST